MILKCCGSSLDVTGLRLLDYLIDNGVQAEFRSRPIVKEATHFVMKGKVRFLHRLYLFTTISFHVILPGQCTDGRVFVATHFNETHIIDSVMGHAEYSTALL